MPDRRRILLLVNKHSARGDSEISSVVNTLRAGGSSVELEQAALPPDIPDLIRDRAHRTDLLVVGGGDGTLNAVADVVLEVGMPLGIVPMGTANDLARTLGIPEDPIEACRVIVEGHTTRIDLGWVNGKHFFNVASLGASVEIARAMQRRRDRNARWGVLSYPIALVESAAACRPFTARLRVDNHQQTVRSLQISVGNGRHYGGGMTVADDAAIDDQALDLYSLKERPAWQIALHLPALRAGRHSTWDGIFHLRGREIFIETDVPMPINTDGELTTETPAHFRVIPKAMDVFTPPPIEAHEPSLEKQANPLLRSDAQIALDEVLVRLETTAQHYGDSAELVADPAIAAFFQRIAEHRADLAWELERRILDSGDYPDEPDDDREVVGQLARRVKVAFADDQRESLLRERLGDDEDLASAASKALTEEIPKETAEWLQTAQKHISETINQVRENHEKAAREIE